MRRSPEKPFAYRELKGVNASPNGLNALIAVLRRLPNASEFRKQAEDLDIVPPQTVLPHCVAATLFRRILRLSVSLKPLPAEIQTPARMTLKQTEFGMTVKRKRKYQVAASEIQGSEDLSSPKERRMAPRKTRRQKALDYASAEGIDAVGDGMAEAPGHIASAIIPRIGVGKDQVKGRAIKAAYRKSKTLDRFDRPLRARWSILKEERLATVFGTYVRGEDVFRIDLASAVNVDEWLECEAQLAGAGEVEDKERVARIKDQIEWIESQLSGYPANSIFGVICKLMIWRRKNKDLLAPGNEEGGSHRLAYAAYADLIRLTGFLSVACGEDVSDGIF